MSQAGSYVDAEKARFDFNHFEPMTAEELAKVESLVNGWILEGDEVVTIETDPETAKSMGAMALFGEKYGKVVRLVKMGGESVELCGGTHLSNTAKAGLFKILTETSVAAGVRRIEAVTGENILKYIDAQHETISAVAKAMKLQNIHEVAEKAEAQTEEIKSLKAKIEELSAAIAASKTAGLMDGAKKVGDFTFVTAVLDGLSPADPQRRRRFAP